MDESRRGIKLLGKLKGDAFEKMELVTPEQLRVDDSVKQFVRLIKAKYEPL